MRTITVKIPRLPVAPVVATDSGTVGTVAFGPIGWEWASKDDGGLGFPTFFDPALLYLSIKTNDFAVATCPGAVSWRLDSAPASYSFFSLNGAAVIEAISSVATGGVVAISAAGAELVIGIATVSAE